MERHLDYMHRNSKEFESSIRRKMKIQLSHNSHALPYLHVLIVKHIGLFLKP